MKKLILLFAVLVTASLSYAQTSQTGRIINGPAASRPTCGSAPNAQNGDIYNDTDDANSYKCYGGTWSSLGGGGSPGGVSPDIQCNLSSAFSNCSGVQANAKFDMINYGPNPWADAAQYGVRTFAAGQLAIATGCTATMSGTSTSATLSAACGLQNNDGIIIYGAGQNNPISTPAIASVTPTGPRATTGSYASVASQTGATTYNYCAAAWNPGNNTATNPGTAETACSTVATITNGLATLGPQSVSISSITCASGTCTVTTSGAQTLAAGEAFEISGAVPVSFNGLRNVTTWTDSTHFTYKSTSFSTIDDYPASATTPGTLYWKNSNTILVTAATGSTDGTRYIIYRSGPGGGGAIACITLPQYSAQSAKPWYNMCEDYGATYSPAPTLPFYIATTAPNSATNEGLSTYITAGGGTTSITVNDASVNAVSGNTILYDAGVGLERAGAAQIALGTGRTKVYIRTPTTSQSYYINAPTILPNVGYVFRGGLVLQDTLFTGAFFQGDPLGLYTYPAFDFNSHIIISCTRAYPCIETTGGYQLTGFQMGFPESGIGILSVNAPLPATWEDDINLTANGNGYTSINHLYQYGSGAGSFNIGKIVFSGAQLATGIMDTPGLLFLGGGAALNVGAISASGKGITWEVNTGAGGFSMNFTNTDYFQKTGGPFLTLFSQQAGTSTASVSIVNSCNDTGASPSWIASLAGVGILNLGINAGTACGGTPANSNFTTTSGGNATIINFPPAFNYASSLSETTGLTSSSYASEQNFLWNGGTLNSNGAVHTTDFGTDIAASAGHQFYVKGYTPTAPSCSAVAGSGPPANTYYVAYMPIYESGNGGTLSAVCTVTTSGGNLSIQANWTPIVSAKGYSFYVSTTNLAGSFQRYNSAIITSLPYTLSTNSPQGDPYGRPADGTIGAANGLLHAQTLVAPTVKVGTTNSATAAPVSLTSIATAARTQNLVDASGTIPLVQAIPCLLPNATGTAIAPNCASDNFSRTGATINAGNSAWLVGGVGTGFNLSGGTVTPIASVPDTAIYTNGQFTPDQTVTVYIPNDNGAVGYNTGPLARMSADGKSGYGCERAGGNLNMTKWTNGTPSFTGLGAAGYTAPVYLTINTSGTTITCTAYVPATGTTYTGNTTDASFTSGYPGLFSRNASGNITQWFATPLGNSTSTSVSGVAYNTVSSAVNANISATNMVATTSAQHAYQFMWTVSLITPGTSCVGNTTLEVHAIFTDPNAAGTVDQNLSGTLTLASSGNGTAGFIASGVDTILAKTGTAVQYATENFTAGGSCSPAPTYKITPTLVQIW